MEDGILQELSGRCFAELVEILIKDIPRSLIILGCLQQMERSPKVTNGHVYVSQWPNPDIVVFEDTAYKVLLDCKYPPTTIFANCSTEKLKITLGKSHLKQLFTCSSGILIGDPRCTNIAIENAKLNCCEVQVAAVPHFCALMDAANLVKHECPPGYYIAPLKLQDAQLVDHMWKFGEYGSIGILHTVESHRRRGLAKAVIYHLATKILEEGKIAFNVIEKENEISRQLFLQNGIYNVP
ncbi:hypothetical protein OS493_028867 [Desmophyllum pertusum]|uniref:GCN5-related N-acetyltransferase Rv2170-like domain-containing protein n=1 Tax=Desmophyllum pertusum TaxID=174260 RepID=A0A9X0D143_9CNID|nr:hypothetical protein OS493_028867 [Desmophyllum pertusum]